VKAVEVAASKGLRVKGGGRRLSRLLPRRIEVVRRECLGLGVWLRVPDGGGGCGLLEAQGPRVGAEGRGGKVEGSSIGRIKEGSRERRGMLGQQVTRVWQEAGKGQARGTTCIAS